MKNIIGYIVLIAIWSTTPLTIKWSAVDLSFASGLFWRILVSALLALVILKIKGQILFFRPQVWRIYSISALGIAPNFLLVYWASQRIPSGLISVIFSAVPFLMGILSYYYLGKNVFTLRRILALLLSMLGLVVIFYDQLQVIGMRGVYGIVAMLLAITIFAISGTWLQKASTQISALQTTTGGLCFSVPPLAFAWWWLDGGLPLDIGIRSALSILYLSVVGSLIGFFLYYSLLHRLSAYVVSTVGMISPVFALIIGNFLANEALTLRLIWGAAMVLFGVALYHMHTLRLAYFKKA